jgi:hypothetical protein
VGAAKCIPLVALLHRRHQQFACVHQPPTYDDLLHIEKVHQRRHADSKPAAEFGEEADGKVVTLLSGLVLKLAGKPH